MGNWQTVNVNGVIPADTLVSEGDGTTLIANTDLVNPIWISDDAGMYANQQYSIQLNPQSTMVVDGNTTLYAIAGAGKLVPINVVPGGMSFFQSTILGTSFVVTNAGFFFYNGTPAFGHLIASIVSPGTTHDPFGNPVVNVLNVGNTAGAFMQVDAAGDILLFNGAGAEVIQISPSNQGMFIYTSAGAGLGTLASSDTPSDFVGTDPFGNAVLAGKTEYKKIFVNDWQATQVNSGSINFWVASAPGGPWSLKSTIALQPDEVGLSIASNVNSAQVVIGELAAALEITPSNAAILVTSGLSTFQGQVTIDASRGSLGGLLTVTQELSNPSNAAILLQGQAASDRLIRVSVVGDSNGRFIINQSGRHDWGSGSSGQDCTLQRDSPNLFAMTDTAWFNNGAAEVWNPVTFVNSWANTGGANPNLAYKRIVVDNSIMIAGTITVPVGFTAPSNITTALPTSPNYRPASGPYSIPTWNRSQGIFVRLQYGTGGILSVQAGSGGMVAGNILEIIPTVIPLTL